MINDNKWMQHALELAQQAKEQNEVPVGAVIVLDDQIIGTGWNQPVSSNDPTAHAEIVALRNAAKKTGNYRLPGTTMYVTLEPCPMCAGAMLYARISRLVYAVDEPKSGACGSVFNLLQTDKLNHQIEINSGEMEQECRTMIQNFFRERRKKT